MNLISRTSKISLVAGLALATFLTVQAWAGTIILSTTTFPGADEAGVSSVGLSEVGAFYFDMVVTSSGTAFTSVDVYIQQEGIAGGQLYTVFNSTFTQCTAPCTRFIVPDMFLGGNVRARFTVLGGSATIKVTARKATP